MPPTDHYHHSPFSSLGRSILTINRRDQVHAMDNHGSLSPEKDTELDSFQHHVTDLFAALLASDDLLSLSWLHKLLDSFLLIQEHFRSILINNKPLLLSRPPLDRSLSDFFDRSIKALDLCNAIRHGIDQVSDWKTHLEIIVTALDSHNRTIIGEGQIRRAKKSLTELNVLTLDEKELASQHRNRSFDRIKSHPNCTSSTSSGHFRSLSWSVSRSWSAARQLQAIGANLAAPRGHEIQSTSGLAIPFYTMSSVLVFVMWALVAAIPCQDRGMSLHLSLPRHFAWGGAVMSLYDKILEESRRRERKNSSGLLVEIGSIERCTRRLSELIDDGNLKEREVKECVRELRGVCEGLKEGLEPLERQVKEVFRRIVRNRSDGLMNIEL